MVNRVATSPPALWGKGMNTLITFGSVVIGTYSVADVKTAWLRVILSSVVAGTCLGCAATALASLLVLPSSAGAASRRALARALRGAGHAASRNASRLLRPGGCHACVPPVLVLDHAAVELLPGVVVPDESRDDEAAVLAHLRLRARRLASSGGGGSGKHKHEHKHRRHLRRRAAQLFAADGKGSGADGGGATAAAAAAADQAAAEAALQAVVAAKAAGRRWRLYSAVAGPPLASLEPRLARAAALLGPAAAEPPWLAGAGCSLRDLGALIGAARDLVNTLVAVESVLEDEGVCLPHENQVYLDALAGAHATAAAAIGAVAAAVGAAPGTRGAAGAAAAAEAVCDAEGWERLRGQLREGMRREQHGYWSALRAGTRDAPAVARTIQQV